MLEEEDAEMPKYGYKRVAWPPPTESFTRRSMTPQPAYHQARHNNYPQSPQRLSTNHQTEFHQNHNYSNQNICKRSIFPCTVSILRGVPENYSSYNQTNLQYQPLTNPISKESFDSYSFYPGPNKGKSSPENSINISKRWAHVRAPTPRHLGYTQQSDKSYINNNSLNYQQSQTFNTPASYQCQHSTDNQKYEQYYSKTQQQATFENSQSPGIIILRKEAPFSQQSPPVYTSQPAAQKYQGGCNMRGDLKWPPSEYKAQVQIENEERRKLAKGAAFRPRRVNRDYSNFFAKNAINNRYPGYRVPPGTQHVYVSQ